MLPKKPLGVEGETMLKPESGKRASRKLGRPAVAHKARAPTDDRNNHRPAETSFQPSSMTCAQTRRAAIARSGAVNMYFTGILPELGVRLASGPIPRIGQMGTVPCLRKSLHNGWASSTPEACVVNWRSTSVPFSEHRFRNCCMIISSKGSSHALGVRTLRCPPDPGRENTCYAPRLGYS